MSMICIGGVCIPYSSLIPLLLILFRPLWEYFTKLMGWNHNNNNNNKKEEQQEKEQQEEKKEKEEEKNYFKESNHLILTEEMNFNEIISSLSLNTLIICRFTAVWCKPCKAVEPIFYETIKKNINIKFITIDVDLHDELFQSLQILSIPHIQIYKNGQLVKSLSGNSTSNIQESINQLL